MKWLLALCFLFPIAVFAEQFPALFDVVGVDATDQLNIRHDPAADTQVLGSLAHDAADVEVVMLSGTKAWGLVNIGERSGWVSMRFLRRVTDTHSGSFPRPLRCFGTEPFWSAKIPVSGPVVVSFPNENPIEVELESPAIAQGRNDKFGFLASTTDTGIVGAVTRAACSDGMSDRAFGMAIDLLTFPDDGDGTLLSGCCSLSE